MTVVTGSNIYSVAFNTMYNVLSGNVLDPEIVGKRKSGAQFFIMSTFPDVESTRFPGWPVIAIEPFISSTIKDTFSYTPNNTHTVSTSIWMYSRSARELDVLSDDVRDALLTNRQSFASSGLPNLTITSAATDTDLVGNDRIHWKRFDVNVGAVTN